MCGICGLYTYKHPGPVSSVLLRSMSDIIAHRGPDGTGEYFDHTAGVGFGHRRLSIIDLATGDQPMCNEDQTVWLIFNGEIYNYRELRHDLIAKGHVFRTSSDTEVIIHSYEEYGDQCALHFNGIFAFAIWDMKRRSMLLARDHFGVKPLYYWNNGSEFRFASEIKSLLADPAIPREVDVDSLNLSLTFRYCPAPRTLFKGIFKLAPASYIRVDESGVRIGKYWDETPQVDHSDPATAEARWVEELSAEYDEAVKRQMMSDVPIGISLSGGVDSTTVLALMNKYSTGPVNAYTIGFAGRDDVNEIEYARKSASHFNTAFTAQTLTEQDYTDFMTRYIWHMEEPVVNQSAAAYYFVAKMARDQGVKVLLNGQGPDEAFAGYPRHLGAAYVSNLRHMGLGLPSKGLFPLVSGSKLPETYRRMLYALGASNDAEALLRIYSLVPHNTRQNLLSPNVRRAVNDELPLAWVQQQLKNAPTGNLLEKMLYIDARTGLSEELLLSEDKMSMAASIEARVPFLDLKVMALAESMPGNVKIQGKRQKVIHKKACATWLPDEVVNRRKIGFVSAADKWLRGQLGQQFIAQINDSASFTRQYLNGEAVKKLIDQHLSGQWDHQRVLFMLFSMENWHSVFLKGEDEKFKAAAKSVTNA